jgi:hypothetical protein
MPGQIRTLPVAPGKSALWFEATRRLIESGVVPPHSMNRGTFNTY